MPQKIVLSPNPSPRPTSKHENISTPSKSPAMVKPIFGSTTKRFLDVKVSTPPPTYYQQSSYSSFKHAKPASPRTGFGSSEKRFFDNPVKHATQVQKTQETSPRKPKPITPKLNVKRPISAPKPPSPTTPKKSTLAKK